MILTQTIHSTNYNPQQLLITPPQILQQQWNGFLLQVTTVNDDTTQINNIQLFVSTYNKK